MIDDVQPVAIEAPRQQFLGQRHAHAVGQPLAQRAGGGLHAGRFAVFRMPGRGRMQLAEILQIFQGERIAGQVQDRIEQHRAVAVGDHETVAVEPVRVGGVVAVKIVEQDFGNIGHAHRHAGVAGVGALNGVHGKGADGVGELAAVGHGSV